MKRTRILYITLVAILLSVITGCAGISKADTNPKEINAQMPPSQPQITDIEAPAEVIPSDDPQIGVFDLESRTVLLNSGYEMPILGIGCYLLSQEQAETRTNDSQIIDSEG